jgi:hypothetical protein
VPEVMLQPDWPSTFRRTLRGKGRKTETFEFQPGVPVDFKPADIELLTPDLGRALVPVYRDEKGRPRVISGEVEVDVSQSAG